MDYRLQISPPNGACTISYWTVSALWRITVASSIIFSHSSGYDDLVQKLRTKSEKDNLSIDRGSVS